MPIISVFFGIIIRMYYKEHEPGHFYAEHQGQQGKFAFSGENEGRSAVERNRAT